MKIISRDQDIASVLIEWGWSHYSRVQGEGVGTEQKLCLTSTSEWKVIFWIEIYHGSLNINRECLNSGEYIGRGWSQTYFIYLWSNTRTIFCFMKRKVCRVSRGFSGSLSEIKTNPLHTNGKKITICTECVMLHLILVCICVEESVSLWS